jgi:hypothetical protein
VSETGGWQGWRDGERPCKQGVKCQGGTTGRGTERRNTANIDMRRVRKDREDESEVASSDESHIYMRVGGLREANERKQTGSVREGGKRGADRGNRDIKCVGRPIDDTISGVLTVELPWGSEGDDERRKTTRSGIGISDRCR